MVDNLYRSHGLFHTLPIIFPVIVSSESVFYEEMTYKVYCTAIRLLFDKEFQFFFKNTKEVSLVTLLSLSEVDWSLLDRSSLGRTQDIIEQLQVATSH
jgi:hypothetical protein